MFSQVGMSPPTLKGSQYAFAKPGRYACDRHGQLRRQHHRNRTDFEFAHSSALALAKRIPGLPYVIAKNKTELKAFTQRSVATTPLPAGTGPAAVHPAPHTTGAACRFFNWNIFLELPLARFVPRAHVKPPSADRDTEHNICR